MALSPTAEAAKRDLFSGDNLRGPGLWDTAMQFIPQGYKKLDQERMEKHIDYLIGYFRESYEFDMPPELLLGIRCYSMPYLNIELPGGTFHGLRPEAPDGGAVQIDDPEAYREFYFSGDKLKGDKLKTLALQFIPSSYETMDPAALQEYIDTIVVPYFTYTLGFEIPEELRLAIQAYVMPIYEENIPDDNNDHEEMGLEYNPYNYTSWTNFTPPEEPKPDWTLTGEEFQKLRNHGSMESAFSQLNSLAIDVSGLSPESFQKGIARVCFIAANSYSTGGGGSLGVGPLNDAITVAANHRVMGYHVYYLHDGKMSQWKAFAEMFMELATERLTLYYTGHGSSATDENGDEADGSDECFCFVDTYIIDDDLAAMVKSHYKGNARWCLLSDCCHSGTIWDIPTDIKKAEKEFPANVISMSAAQDAEQAMQVSGMDGVESAVGAFTCLFFKSVRERVDATPNDVLVAVNSGIEGYGHQAVFTPTSRGIMDEPIFPQKA